MLTVRNDLGKHVKTAVRRAHALFKAGVAMERQLTCCQVNSNQKGGGGCALFAQELSKLRLAVRRLPHHLKVQISYLLDVAVSSENYQAKTPGGCWTSEPCAPEVLGVDSWCRCWAYWVKAPRWPLGRLRSRLAAVLRPKSTSKHPWCRCKRPSAARSRNVFSSFWLRRGQALGGEAAWRHGA